MRLEEYKIEIKIYYREKEQFQKLFNFLNIANVIIILLTLLNYFTDKPVGVGIFISFILSLLSFYSYRKIQNYNYLIDLLNLYYYDFINRKL